MKEHKVYYVGTPQEVSHHAQAMACALDLNIATPEEVRRSASVGDLCIFYNEYFTRLRQTCREMQRRGCLTLYAIDGILEWRNSWEFPWETPDWGDPCE